MRREYVFDLTDGVSGYWRRHPLWAGVQIALFLTVAVALAATASVILLGALVVGIPAVFLLLLWTRIKRRWKEYRYRAGLKTAGRTIAWTKVEPELLAGRGTLIFEVQGPELRVWWTNEDAVGPDADAIPAQLPLGMQMLFGDRGQAPETAVIAERLMRWYLDSEAGKAALVTGFPLEELVASPSARDGSEMSDRYPRARLISVLTDFHPPLIALGLPYSGRPGMLRPPSKRAEILEHERLTGSTDSNP